MVRTQSHNSSTPTQSSGHCILKTRPGHSNPSYLCLLPISSVPNDIDTWATWESPKRNKNSLGEIHINIIIGYVIHWIISLHLSLSWNSFPHSTCRLIDGEYADSWLGRDLKCVCMAEPLSCALRPTMRKVYSSGCCPFGLGPCGADLNPTWDWSLEQNAHPARL